MGRLDGVLKKFVGGGAASTMTDLPGRGSSRGTSRITAVPAEMALDLDAVTTIERIDWSPETGMAASGHVAEEYRALRTNIGALSAERGEHVFSITSCHHNEGKTATAVNLARYMAKNRDQRVVLVDCDLRRPKVKSFAQMKLEVGVEDALRGKVALQDAIFYSAEDNLYMLPARAPHSGASEILSLPAMDAMVEALRAQFDMVIFDAPPMLSTTDPIIIGRKTDATILIIRTLLTQRESVRHAMSLLEQAGVEVAGAVLTFIRYYIPRYLYRYQYYYDYHAYYYEDGGSASRAK